MSYMGECRQQKHIQHAPSKKVECDYLYGWIKKQSQMQKSHPKWSTPEIKLRTQKKKKSCVYSLLLTTTTLLIVCLLAAWCLPNMDSVS